MTTQTIKALRTATKCIRADLRQSQKLYDRLDRKSCTANGLDFEESETHDFEDGFSSDLRLALQYLERELSAVAVKI